MKITEIKYTTQGPMGITYHLRAIATDQGLEKALSAIGDNHIKSKDEKEVDSVTEFFGKDQDRFTSYFMDGAKYVRKEHPSILGGNVSHTYS